MSWNEDDLRSKLKKNPDGTYSPKNPVKTFTIKEPVKEKNNRYELLVEPMGAVRMSSSDRWKTNPNHPDPKKRQRPIVNKLFKHRDLLRAEAARVGLTIPNTNFRVIFYISMPETWRKGKKEDLVGTAHEQKPDVDNLLKNLMDTLMKEDKSVSDCRITKLWAYQGKIVVITNIEQ